MISENNNNNQNNSNSSDNNKLENKSSKNSLKSNLKEEKSENKSNSEKSKEDMAFNDSSLEIAEQLSNELLATKLKMKESFDSMLRAKAELENYKKRSKKEMKDFKKYALEKIIKDLLIVVDNLERAIQSSKENKGDNKNIIEGLELTLNEMIKLLERYNISVIKSVGKIFDPKIHQAMSQEITSKYPSNTIVTEFLKGYLMHERLIRPAMVSVSKKPDKKMI